MGNSDWPRPVGTKLHGSAHDKRKRPRGDRGLTRGTHRTVDGNADERTARKFGLAERRERVTVDRLGQDSQTANTVDEWMGRWISEFPVVCWSGQG